MWWTCKSFQFPSKCHTWISYFSISLFLIFLLFFFPSPVPTACIFLFFSRLLAYFLTYLATSFSFIGILRAYGVFQFQSHSLSGANSLPDPNVPWDILEFPVLHLDWYSGSWPISKLPGLNRGQWPNLVWTHFIFPLVLDYISFGTFVLDKPSSKINFPTNRLICTILGKYNGWIDTE